MKIRKAVITAAGWGTRFLPATKAQPKETLPLVDKPMIQYVVEEAVASGIEQIIIVTAHGKRAIEDYFDRSFELEQVLEQKGEEKLLREIRRISELADVCYIRQKEQLGLGHAIMITEALVGKEPFAVFLPDDIIDSHVPAMKQMIGVFERFGASVVAVEKVSRETIRSYGVVEPERVDHRVYRALSLVEKPSAAEAPSNLGIVGRYILTPDIFKSLRSVKPGAGGEIQITDGLTHLLKRQPIYAYEFEGVRYDAGTPLGFLKASVGLALRNPEVAPGLKEYLRELSTRDFKPPGKLLP
ncbi:MAG: UTP--glucose-1-phosphate uridylyltransferase GalU [Chloroflexi bacterium]|nr:UTP--glucose-1-phosphate uridylyltransferase GalU [Chloroflexota bacterium]